jgi:hypothetical protein
MRGHYLRVFLPSRDFDLSELLMGSLFLTDAYAHDFSERIWVYGKRLGGTEECARTAMRRAQSARAAA